MLELSIADSILTLARTNMPAGATLRSVQVIAGPMRAIDPDCLQAAWQAIGQSDVDLLLCSLPWTMNCGDCGRRWEQPDLPERCQCGSSKTTPVGGDELQLYSIEVDDADPDPVKP